MRLNDDDIRNYFRPAEFSFWRWEDHGLVASWWEGNTIAFRSELLGVLRHLAPQGLPPLDAILLVLAACRESWESLPSRQGLLAGLLSTTSITTFEADAAASATVADTIAGDTQRLLADVCEGLAIVHRLVRDSRVGAHAEPVLCAMIFQSSAGRTYPATAAKLVAALEAGLTEEQMAPRSAADLNLELRRNLRCLSVGFGRASPELLLRRLQTGLDELPQSASIELPPPSTAAALIHRLLNHSELGGVARLARQLMAVVGLPRRMDDPDDLQQGGVSDITNRGPLDRLLLSELAHDDMTLAARIATGEALYLRRESPPAAPPRKRQVLLDSGIRMWGVPRVLATAVGLALAAIEKSPAQIEVHRAFGPDLDEVDLTTEQGLTDHLAVLDFRAHPGESLQAWQKLVSAGEEMAEALLVTGEDVLADPAFQLLMRQVTFDQWHVATVSREGRFRLLRRTRLGTTIVREAHLSLDDVLPSSPESGKSPYVAQPGSDPPIFLLQRPLPLRLAGRVDRDCAWHVRNRGVLSLTSDGRLLLWTRPDRGARELAAGLPRGKVHWAAPVATGGAARAVVGRLGEKGLCSLAIDLDNERCQRVRLQIDGKSPRGAFYHNGYVFVLFARRINILDAQTGELRLSRGTSFQSWRNSRFGVVQGDHPTTGPLWVAMAFDGMNVVYENVLVERTIGSKIVAMFNAGNGEGPVAVTSDGEIVFSDGRRKRIGGLNAVADVLDVSRDGLRITVRCKSTGANHLVDLDGNAKFIGYLCSSTEPELPKYNQTRTLRRRFRGIGVNSRRELAPVSRRGTTWPIRFDSARDTYALVCDRLTDGPGQKMLHFARDAYAVACDRLTDGSGLKMLRFESHDAWSSTPYADLGVACWTDGSRAVLDPRGLLHLQSSDDRIPACTIALTDQQPTAGWTSDGRWWGSSYFIGDNPATPVSVIMNEVIRPFVERLE